MAERKTEDAPSCAYGIIEKKKYFYARNIIRSRRSARGAG